MITPARAEQIRHDLEGKDVPGGPRYFDKDGRPIPLWRWVVLIENEMYCRVAETHLWPGIRISTVWLGLNHGFGESPSFFETMVLTAHDGWGDTERYGSLPAAKFGHQCQVQIWQVKRWWMLLHVWLLDPVRCAIACVLAVPLLIAFRLLGGRKQP